MRPAAFVCVPNKYHDSVSQSRRSALPPWHGSGLKRSTNLNTLEYEPRHQQMKHGIAKHSVRRQHNNKNRPHPECRAPTQPIHHMKTTAHIYGGKLFMPSAHTGTNAEYIFPRSRSCCGAHPLYEANHGFLLALIVGGCRRYASC